MVGCGFGLGEDVDLVGEQVGGDGAQDVVAVPLEVLEICVDGGGARPSRAPIWRRESPWQSKWWASNMRWQRLGVGGLLAAALSMPGSPLFDRYVCSEYASIVGGGQGW